jgi:hypothetical protein
MMVVAGLVACNSTPAVPTPDPTQVALELAGKYTVQLTAEDLQKSGFSGAGLENNLGAWLFEIESNGNFTASQNGQFIASGNLGAWGNELKIQMLRVCDTCSCGGNIGRYTYAISSASDSNPKQLIFQKIYDTCDAMAFALTAKPLQGK